MIVSNFNLKTKVKEALCTLRQIVDYAEMHPTRRVRQLALDDTVAFIRERCPEAVGVRSEREVLEYALRGIGGSGHILEFGVYRGGSIRHIARTVPNRTIDGFDSFDGLPEDWTGVNVPKGTFSRLGASPRVSPWVRLHRGWFKETLPAWLRQHPGPADFIHIDSDLYSSARTVLTLLADRIVPGTVIVFDEYFNYPNWQAHEHKAFEEFLATTGATVDYLCYGSEQLAVRIASRP